MGDNNEAWTERGSGKGFQNENWQIRRFGNPIGEFAVFVLGELLKRKLPKIIANWRKFTSIRTGLSTKSATLCNKSLPAHPHILSNSHKT
jgi:hypothetical protein